jgi:hypothetical protein
LGLIGSMRAMTFLYFKISVGIIVGWSFFMSIAYILKVVKEFENRLSQPLKK